MDDGELLTDIAQLDALVPEWDALAVAAGRPYCAPAWQLAWWRNAAPAGAELRVVVVRDGASLAGIAPLYVSTARTEGAAYRFLAAPHSSPVEPLARPGRERDVAAALGRWLDRTTPRPDALLFEGVAAGSPWPPLVAREWHRPGAAEVVEDAVPAPRVDCSAASFEEWLATRRGHFRKRLRAARRRIDRRGGEFVRVQTPAEARLALTRFAELHRARWAKKEIRFLDERLEHMLLDAAAELVEAGRLRVWTLVTGAQTVAVEVLAAAGGTVSSWQGAFDETWAAEQPSFQTLVAALEEAFASGDALFDLGPGGQEFKYRLADHEVPVRWVTLVPRGRGYAVRRARRTLVRLPRTVASKVPAGPKTITKRLVRRWTP